MLDGYLSINIPECTDKGHIKIQINNSALKVTCFTKTNDTDICSVEPKYVQMWNGGNLW